MSIACSAAACPNTGTQRIRLKKNGVPDPNTIYVCEEHKKLAQNAGIVSEIIIAVPVRDLEGDLEKLELDPNGPCRIKGCKPARTALMVRGLCKYHYDKCKLDKTLDRFAAPSASPARLPPLAKRATMIEGACRIEGCSLPPACRGLCMGHYNRAQKDKVLDRFANPAQTGPNAATSPTKATPPMTIVPPPPAEIIDLPPTPLEVAENDVRGLSKILAETGLELQNTRAQLKDAQKNLEDYAQVLQQIDQALGLDPETTTEDARLTAIRGLRDQVAAQDNAIRTMRPVAPMSREEIMRRASAFARADALRAEADALEAEALRGAA